MKSTFRTASFLIALCFTSITTLYAAPDDEWNSGKQFHIPVSGAPLQTEGNPVEGNPWEYGFRMARGYNDGKWSHMDAGPFQPFPLPSNRLATSMSWGTLSLGERIAARI